MGILHFLFGPKEEEVAEYEDDHQFEGVPDGNDVREQGAPSMFGNYSNYPGGYAQAVKDWLTGDYVAPVQEVWTADDEPEPEREPKKSWWSLW